MGEFADIIERKVRVAAAQAFDHLANKVASDSEPLVPLKYGELKASALYPANDEGSRCDPDALEVGSLASYNTVYAAAQEAGWAEQHRMHPVVPIKKGGLIVGWFTDKSRIQERDVIWTAKLYTEPGTGAHFLSDPYKAMVPRMEPFVAASIKAALDS